MKAKWMLALMVATASATGVAMAGDTEAGGSAGVTESTSASSGTMEQGDAGKDRSTMHTNRSTMDALDLDQDDVISSDEAHANQELAEQFDQLDQNDDDMLDQGEFARFEGAAQSESGTSSNY